jgi:hypothetical protein
MEGKNYRIGFTDLGLTVEGIENVMGYSRDEGMEYIACIIDDVLKECSRIADIRAEYRIFEKIRFDNAGKTFSVENSTFNVGKIVFNQIKKSEAAAFFLCTAGSGPGLRSKKFMHDKDLLTGYIYDVVGSEMVEAATDLMQNDLEQSVLTEKLRITNRYSPGYCGWNVIEQHKLFSFFPQNYCGISLLPSALMDPSKSVSGVIGIGAQVKKNPYTCSLCDMENCIYRRLREVKT